MTVFEKLQGMIAKEMNVDIHAITQESSVVMDLGADSLALADFVVKVEREFKLEITDAELKGLDTVGDIAAFIATRIGVQGAA